MINLGYCRFNNTALALEECIDALKAYGLTDLSEEEQESAISLYELAEKYIKLYNGQKK